MSNALRMIVERVGEFVEDSSGQHHAHAQAGAKHALDAGLFAKRAGSHEHQHAQHVAAGHHEAAAHMTQAHPHLAQLHAEYHKIWATLERPRPRFRPMSASDTVRVREDAP